MAINQKVAEVLENQINKELYSAYLYLTFADYYEDRGLKPKDGFVSACSTARASS